MVRGACGVGSEQCLDGYGCSEAARMAEREAGVMALSENVRDFRRCVLEGDWEGLDRFFANATEFCTEDDAQKAKFELNRQRYLELLDHGATLVRTGNGRPDRRHHRRTGPAAGQLGASMRLPQSARVPENPGVPAADGGIAYRMRWPC